MTCDNVLNPADPDAIYNKRRGVGYLVQVMETNCDVEPEPTEDAPASPPDLITHVAVGPMNVHDGFSLEPALVDAEARGINPEVVLADSHYGSNENLEKANLQGVEVVSPSMPPKGSQQEKLTLEQFELDGDGRVVRCPQRHAPVMTSAGEDKIQGLFDVATCAACPLHQSCCASAVDRKEPRCQYTHDRVRQREGTMSRFKYQMGMASLRIRGRVSVGYVSFLRALGLNIHRVAAFKVAC